MHVLPLIYIVWNILIGRTWQDYSYIADHKELNISEL